MNHPLLRALRPCVRVSRWLILLVAAVCSAHAAAPITQSCKKNFDSGRVILRLQTEAQIAEFVAIANEPARDPDIYRRLWQPDSGKPSLLSGWVELQYDTVQDTEEIASALKGDPVLVARGLVYAQGDGSGACFAALPPGIPVQVIEFHNRMLGHFFLSSSTAENDAIESGAAGPGWERTGESFNTIRPDYCHGAYPVFRFYAPGPSSHFFTVDAGECGLVRNKDPGWHYEGEAFGARSPSQGACAVDSTPVYRLYNNRWMFNDSNHRYVTRLDLYQEMQARGWIGEGVAFCTVNR